MGEEERKVQFRDVAPALEFMCWVVVVLMPILRLINGAAVTSDQFAIQVSLFVMALSSAIVFRLYLMLSR